MTIICFTVIKDDFVVWSPDNDILPAPISDLLRSVRNIYGREPSVHNILYIKTFWLYFVSHHFIENLLPHCCVTLRVHEYTYLSHLEAKCHLAHSTGRSSDGDIKSNGHSLEQQKMPYFYAPTGNLDVDTPLVAKSLTASRMFCG